MVSVMVAFEVECACVSVGAYQRCRGLDLEIPHVRWLWFVCRCCEKRQAVIQLQGCQAHALSVQSHSLGN